jgi:hypothetical protein
MEKPPEDSTIIVELNKQINDTYELLILTDEQDDLNWQTGESILALPFLPGEPDPTEIL